MSEHAPVGGSDLGYHATMRHNGDRWAPWIVQRKQQRTTKLPGDDRPFPMTWDIGMPSRHWSQGRAMAAARRWIQRQQARDERARRGGEQVIR